MKNYKYEIKFHLGKANMVTDALKRTVVFMTYYCSLRVVIEVGERVD